MYPDDGSARSLPGGVKKPTIRPMDDRMDAVWNRAAVRKGGASPRPGDKALTDLLSAHGLVMNGGVLHAVECFTPSQLDAATDGYRYFGMEDAGDVLRAAQIESSSETLTVDEAGQLERDLDDRYAECVPTDGTIVQAFQERFRVDPTAFAPPEE
jgi:hypothetical protein